MDFSSNVSWDINKFISFLNKGNFIFLNASGVPFTSCYGHQDNSIMFERLDRAIVNSQRLLDNPDCKLHNFPIIGSDHSPILLSTRCSNQVRKK